jgi:hypothetical protein
MTVAQLIRKLGQFHPDQEVWMHVEHVTTPVTLVTGDVDLGTHTSIVMLDDE